MLQIIDLTGSFWWQKLRVLVEERQSDGTRAHEESSLALQTSKAEDFLERVFLHNAHLNNLNFNTGSCGHAHESAGTGRQIESECVADNLWKWAEGRS